MSGNNNFNDPRNQQFRQHIPGQVPPFIDPRAPNMAPGRHPIPPIRFPGQQPQQPHFPGQPQHPQFPGQPQHPQFPGQPGFNNRPVPGAPPLVHQPNQFQNMHQKQFHPVPTPSFSTIMQAQNMFPPRTSSGSSSNSTSTVTSPTQPPSRKLPPVPGDNSSSGIENRSTDSLRSGFQEIKKKVDELKASHEEESIYEKSMKKGVDLVLEASVVATANSTVIQKGISAATDAINGSAKGIVCDIEKNPILNHLIQLADKLVDVGKTVPFIAPAFVIIKVIIDIEQKAKEADAKCTDLLERINFMVSNITVLEKVKVIDPLRAVIEKMNDILKQAASLIEAYRKQGAIARRLNMSNNQNFISMAGKITSCTQDLMLSLQIQQTGDISVLTRSVPLDTQDVEAQNFVKSHGGQSVVNSDPALVEEFAKKMQLAMSDQVMDQMQSNMEDILEENQSRIEELLKENSSNTIAETIKALAADVREREAEQRLICLQCDKEYRESANGPEACSFHRTNEQGGSYPCCGNKAPCKFSNHRSVHHCEYPYTNFFDYAYSITGYCDTVDQWAEINEKDMVTNEIQKASISKLVRWRSRQERISKPMMVIHVGRIYFDDPYYFQAFDAEDLKAANTKVRGTGNTLIFKSTESDSEYAMAEWTRDDAGDINGVKLSCKVSTSETATVKVVPLDIKTVSPSGEVQTLSKSKFKLYKPAESYKLPENHHVGHILRSTALREVREFKTKTKLPLVVAPQGKMKANTEGQFVRNNADKFQGTLRIFNKSPPNSQTYVTLASCKAEYRLVGESEYKEVETLNLGNDVKFPMSIAPTQSLDVPFEAIVPRGEAQAALKSNCWYWAMVALHNPIRIRLTFKDIEDEECVLVQEYIHQPSKRMATKDEEKDLLFLHIDDSLDGTRSAVRITKANSDDHVINVNGNSLSVDDLNKIVYNAGKSGVTEVDLGYGRDNGTYKWNAWALVDLNCQRVYGFKVLLTVGSSRTKKTTAALGYASCPLYGEEEGEELEERPIQYAVEEAIFPELEPEDPIDVVVDDDVDDEKIVIPAKSIEPVVAVAAAASSSVTAAISEVSKATSSLDTAVFSSSMASLEKRLESLDTNVARMANALEKLVVILSQ
ncbi:hypothetical protein BGZ80_008077 [Entomortierella chlamydospora]|uniref:Uncharacterized protein n=1 Tax=Entomortierella chlamydospora TaxID=101097 RepID=A0A9P6T1C0_9FUNG|nr:hypothetical protein BGZ79_009038 [Entomortierella chlamydospora]KAG0017637.1 hypothetical protein BGZ80_008077 [Entomortierella chlamydospora]